MIVLFDLDSTLVQIEGLDYIAHQKGLGEQVEHLTRQTMEGSLPFEEVFEKKLDIIAPSRKEIDALGKKYQELITEGAKDVIVTLKSLGHKVGIVTANFQPAVYPVAEKLGIEPDYVFTNEIFFHDDGSYSHFDKTNTLAKNYGKKNVVKDIKEDTVIFIGDSATDLEVQDVASFIGFGGVVERATVKQHAKRFLKSKSLLPLLEILLSDEEKDILNAKGHRVTLQKAKELAKENLS